MRITIILILCLGVYSAHAAEKTALSDIFKFPENAELNPSKWTDAQTTRMTMVFVVVGAAAFLGCSLLLSLGSGVLAYGLINLSYPLVAGIIAMLYGWKRNHRLIMAAGIAVTYYYSFVKGGSNPPSSTMSPVLQLYNLTDIQLKTTGIRAWIEDYSPYCRVNVHYADSWFANDAKSIPAHCREHLKRHCFFTHHYVLNASFTTIIGEELLVVQCIGLRTTLNDPTSWTTVYTTEPPLESPTLSPYYITRTDGTYNVHSLPLILLVPLMLPTDSVPRNVITLDFDDVFVPFKRTTLFSSSSMGDLMSKLYTHDQNGSTSMAEMPTQIDKCTQILDTGASDEHLFQMSCYNQLCNCPETMVKSIHHTYHTLDEIEEDRGYFVTVFSPITRGIISLVSEILQFIIRNVLDLVIDAIGIMPMIINAIIFSIFQKFTGSYLLSFTATLLVRLYF